ncbi:MAG: FAD-binding oxidoreductase [Actinobacteria bacterium]|nr:FAD-binding oxidoreductase [Actinomycetota bacterium]
MSERADAVVIGAGILGASVAHALTKLGFGDVSLLDKGAVCSGSTRYSAANVRQHYSNEVGIRLALRAVEMFERDEEELGGPSGFVRCGYMVMAPPGEERAIRDVVPLQRSLGVQTEILSPDEVAERYPELDVDGIALACLEPASGYADPVLTTRSLVDSARRRGLAVHEGRAVTGIERTGGRVTGVSTSAGAIATPVVVNAAGPWGDRIGRLAGIEYRLTFSREHEAQLELPSGFGEVPVTSDAAQRFYFRPHGPGRLLVGEGWPKEVEPDDPETYDPGTDDEHVRRMLEKLFRRVPGLRDRVRYLTGYSGMYDITDDWYPIVGAEPALEGYYTAFGGSGHCFKLGPPLGEALADVIAGREPAIDISPLRHSRFEEGDTFSSVWGPGNRA